MIRDYFVLIFLLFSMAMITLVSSFVYYVTLESLVEQFAPTNTTHPMYNMTRDPDGVLDPITSDTFAPFRMIFNLIQLCGVLSMILSIIVSTLIVAKVRYSQFGIPIAIILYFIGIFVSMVFSNAYAYFADTLETMVSTFTINTYLNWFSMNLPYVVGIVGAILFILAYTKTPLKNNPSGGGGFTLPSG